MPWAKAIAVTTVVFLVAGAVGGWAWQQFSPLAKYTVDENGGALGEEQMTRVFGPDGTFTAIGFLAALVLGGALFWWLRNYGPWSVAIVVLGAALGSGVAWGVGMLLGHDPIQPRLEAAKPGDLVAAPLELHTWTPLRPGWSVRPSRPPSSPPRPGAPIRLQPHRNLARPRPRRRCTSLLWVGNATQPVGEATGHAREHMSDQNTPPNPQIRAARRTTRTSTAASRARSVRRCMPRATSRASGRSRGPRVTRSRAVRVRHLRGSRSTASPSRPAPAGQPQSGQPQPGQGGPQQYGQPVSSSPVSSGRPARAAAVGQPGQPQRPQQPSTAGWTAARCAAAGSARCG